MNISDATCIVVDSGLFIGVAQRLAKQFKRVLYYCPNEESFPTVQKCIIGDGFETFEKIINDHEFWSLKNETDLYVFPDISRSGLQLELERQGKPVWGSRKADSLEIYRQKFHKILAKVGLPVPTYKVVHGLTELRSHLKDEKDKYLKISLYRGSMETWHWRSQSLDEGMLDMLANRFGPAKEIIPFMVFDNLKTDLEIGADTYGVDGKWPSSMLHGLEHKDKGYIGAVTPKDEMPHQLVDVLDAFAPVLKEYRMRNQWSMEVRVVDAQGYFTDPTPRGGLPSTMSQLKGLKNFPEIVWRGANGELVEPDWDCKYTAEAMITGPSKTDWSVVELPEELEDHTMFGNCAKVDGRLVFPADDHKDGDLGWLCATGDTLEEVIDNLKGLADLLPDGLDANTDAMVDLLKEAISARDEKIKFGTQEIPKPESALNI
jgi:hypothetical protein